MDSGKCSAVALALALAVFGTDAAAAVVVATYSGTIASGWDETGVFGSVSADLTGAAFVATFTFDSELGTFHLGPDAAGGEQRYGGGYYGGVGPILGASLSVGNGPAYTFTTSGAATAAAIVPGGGCGPGCVGTHTFSYWTSETSTRFRYEDLDLIGLLGGGPLTLAAAVAGDLQGSGSSGLGLITDWDPITGAYAKHAYVTFAPDHLVAAPAGVPEPEGWALLLVGFAAIGSGLRYQRQRLRLAA